MKKFARILLAPFWLTPVLILAIVSWLVGENLTFRQALERTRTW